MKYVKLVGYFAIGRFIRSSVRRACFLSKCNPPVTVAVEAFSPKKAAGIGFWCTVIKKSFLANYHKARCSQQYNNTQAVCYV